MSGGYECFVDERPAAENGEPADKYDRAPLPPPAAAAAETTDGAAAESEPTASDCEDDDSAWRRRVAESALRRRAQLHAIVCGMAVFSALVTLALGLAIAIGEPEVAPHGAVSSWSARCSAAAEGVLKAGGSAVDAAIAAMLCMGVAHPQSQGLGGGGFMVVQRHSWKRDETRTYDFRETAPPSAPPDTDPHDFAHNPGKSVGVPAELRGMLAAHGDFGRLPWAQLVQPAIDMAEQGLVADQDYVANLEARVRHGDLPATPPANETSARRRFRSIYMNGGGSVKVGDLVRNGLLAALLIQVRDDPAGLLRSAKHYAQPIVDTVSDNGGQMSLSDLSTYTVHTNRTRLAYTYANYSIVAMGAPSGGPLTLRAFRRFVEMRAGNKEKPDGMTDFDRWTQIARSTMSCRAALADPSRADGGGRILRAEKAMAQPDAAGGEPSECAEGRPTAADRGTSHISVMDAQELIVAVTSSLNSYFGSMLVTANGVLLNDQLSDFDPAGALHQTRNVYLPGARPQSSMSPLIFYHTGKACNRRAAFGGVNGTRIPPAVAQALARVLVAGEPLREAVTQPRAVCDASGAWCAPAASNTESGHVAAVMRDALRFSAADDYHGAKGAEATSLVC